jgi:hypothetical protein
MNRIRFAGRGRVCARGAGALNLGVAVLVAMMAGCSTLASALRREPLAERAATSLPTPSAAAAADRPDPVDAPPTTASDTAGSAATAPASAEPKPAPASPAPARREATIATPRSVKPAAGPSTTVYRTALAAKGTRIVVSLKARTLWLMKNDVVVFRGPIAIGMTKPFSYNGRTWDFKTPIGQRKVLGKAADPIWTIPDWHYFEKAARRGLTPVRLVPGEKVKLADGSHLEIRGNEVGRVNHFGNFAPLTVGNEILFDRKIFIPPATAAQRRVPDILGPYKLDMGEGYLIHGTDRETSIGEAVSHGCIRMYNSDVTRLHQLVPVGTPVYIF